MKNGNVKAMSFGFSAVNAGQRNTTVEPQVIATSTEGGFRLTPAVSKALGIGHGDYVMFLSNVDNIDAAIAAKDAVVVAFCEEQGLELGSAEAAIAIHKEFDMWAIAKGIVEYDTKGNKKTCQERLSKNDKIKFATQNFEEMLTAALDAENGVDEETRDELTREGVTKEEQIEVLSRFVKPREILKYKGSKAANPAGLTGAGTVVNFTDTNVWNQIKVDLKDDATKFNRVFDVDIEDLQDVTISNGYEDVTVKALTLGEHTDKEPSRLGKGSEE